MNALVDKYLFDGCMRCPLGATPDCKVHDWRDELEIIRSIILDSGLKEELKWGIPCYTLEGRNIILLSALKDCCTISFLKGVLLDDPTNILEKPGENSQSARYIRIRNSNEIETKEKEIRDLIRDAIRIERSGQKVDFKSNPEPWPEELEEFLDKDPVLKSSFESLTPGRQRGYIIYFSQAKQPATRISRIEKCAGKILNGEGLHDKYSGKKRA